MLIHEDRAGANDALAGCIGKHRFDNQHTAGQVVLKFNQRHHGAHCAYRCDQCNGWHIGNQIPGSKAAKKKAYAEKKSDSKFHPPHVVHAPGVKRS